MSTVVMPDAGAPLNFTHAAQAQGYANDDTSRRSEWYRQYREVSDREPPSPTPLIYEAMLPLLVGITNAGRDLTVDGGRAGLAGFAPYRETRRYRPGAAL